MKDILDLPPTEDSKDTCSPIPNDVDATITSRSVPINGPDSLMPDALHVAPTYYDHDNPYTRWLQQNAGSLPYHPGKPISSIILIINHSS